MNERSTTAALLALVVLVASLAGSPTRAFEGALHLPSLTGTSGGATAGGADKLLHVAGYTALAYAVAAAVRAQTPRMLAGIVLAVTVFGVGIEVVQPSVGRHASALDALANLAGAALGALAWWRFRQRD
ncbi:hypothetical protein [Halobacterium zhouii]|uniref:hypothetical protein n=1 Tax=Halobacterium zhouii TaxID=2902624 RepID=UPI001E28AD4F|nr:hypothetical protein [Halobacterium zhouii]